MKKLVIALFTLVLIAPNVLANNVWVNDLRSLFLSNNAIIYVINMRTFGAQDINKDGIIDVSEGEESGNFLNAISRLDELQAECDRYVDAVNRAKATNAMLTSGQKQQMDYEIRKKRNLLEYGADIVSYIEKMSSNRNILQRKY